jgi:hypothetical protein
MCADDGRGTVRRNWPLQRVVNGLSLAEPRYTAHDVLDAHERGTGQGERFTRRLK